MGTLECEIVMYEQWLVEQNESDSPSLLVCDKWCVLDFRGDIRKAKVVCLCEQIAFIFGSTITDFHWNCVSTMMGYKTDAALISDRTYWLPLFRRRVHHRRRNTDWLTIWHLWQYTLTLSCKVYLMSLALWSSTQTNNRVRSLTCPVISL